MLIMLTIETKELIISEELKGKVEMICKFAGAKVNYKNGSVRSIKGTNIAYAEPHQIIINGINYFIFDESDKVFVANLDTKITLNELENHIKTHKIS